MSKRIKAVIASAITLAGITAAVAPVIAAASPSPVASAPSTYYHE